MDISKPKLIEPGISYWLNNVLINFKNKKNRKINLIFNFVMATIFILAISCFLSFKYKGNLSPEEINKKNNIKKTYILSKLQQLAAIRKKKSEGTNLITNLPILNSPELAILDN